MKAMLAMIMTFVAAAGSGACSSQTDSIVSVPTAAFEKDVKGGDVQLLDVREPEEYAEGHIADAVNISVNNPDFVKETEKRFSKEKPIYVYCRSGRRSLKAAEMLAPEGYRIVNLEGGILDWQEKGCQITR